MRRMLMLLLCLLALPSAAAELTIDMGHGTRRLDTAQLLHRKDLRTIDVPADVAYHRAMHYRAVPLRDLLPELNPDDHLQIVALDGFAAEIDASKILDGHGAEAWLAIESPEAPWPPLAAGKAGAGPFYLVWTHPEAGHVNAEQWPYQIAGIRRLDPVAVRFPAMRPDPALPADGAVRHGFAVFQSHCMACHTLNGEGDARIGPDLNIPHNPTEYLRADLLRVYIRNPQALRQWPQARMPGFGLAQLSDADLDTLLAYLRHMAGRKTATKQP